MYLNRLFIFLFLFLQIIFVGAYFDVHKNHILYYPFGNKILDKNFVPTDLVPMSRFGIDCLRPKRNEGKIKRIVAEDLKSFQDFCYKETGIKIPVRSGYRSFGDQYMSYSMYKEKGSSALPGTSEHQLGLAVDFGSEDSFLEDNIFSNISKCFSENAYKFGFVLSYNYGNPQYIYEPWHYRYVGKKYSKTIRDFGFEKTPWVFLENPLKYLDGEKNAFLAQLQERKENKETNLRNKVYWDNISRTYNLKEDYQAAIFLKNNIINLSKNRDDNFYSFLFAYNYLKFIGNKKTIEDEFKFSNTQSSSGLFLNK